MLGLLGVSGATVSTNVSSRPIAVTLKTKALAARDKLLVYATVVSGKQKPVLSSFIGGKQLEREPSPQIHVILYVQGVLTPMWCGCVLINMFKFTTSTVY